MGFSNLRADRGQLSPPVSATIFEGRVARVHVPGDPLVYRTGPEHRDSTELANIVNQLPNLKIYLGHPEIYPAEKSGQKVVGNVESGRLDDDTAVARMAITDAEALQAVNDGTHELSLGYQCVLDGDKYQRNIVLDHLAIVPVARCGSTCSMRVDMEEIVMEAGTVTFKVELDTTDAEKALAAFTAKVDAMSAMGKAKCETCGESYDKGAEHTCAKSDHTTGTGGGCTCNSRAMSHTSGETTMSDTELQGKLDAALAEVASLKEKVTTLEVEAINARKDAEATKTKLDSAEALASQVKLDADAAVAAAKAEADQKVANEINTRVQARVALVTEASKFALKDAEGNPLKLDALSDREIKCAVIKHVDGDDVPADKPEAFVDGCYAGSVKRGSAASGSREEVRTAINNMRKDNAPLKGADLEKSAKDNMHRASAQAWTKA